MFKKLRRRLRLDEKAAADENEDDNEYLQGIIDRLNKFKKCYLKQNKYHDHNTKYWGVEIFKYLFDEDGDENYKFKLIINNINQIQAKCY